MLTELELTGRARSHVVQNEALGAAIHRDVIAPYLALKAAAAGAGIDLQIVSGFRDFDSQLRIWNAKYRGERPLYDGEGRLRDHASLDHDQLIAGILCWSALPGASRHHWGSELDVIDRAAVPEDYRYRLLPEEYGPGGVFHRLHLWLEDHSARFGFFRPYADYRGGVYPERWHLSHAAVATAAMRLLTLELVEATVRESEILGKEHVLEGLPEIYDRYVANVAAAPLA